MTKTAGARYLAAYRKWLGLEPYPPGATTATRSKRQHKATSADLDLSGSIELVALSVKEEAAPCRLLGSDRVTTLRASRLWDVVPARSLWSRRARSGAMRAIPTRVSDLVWRLDAGTLLAAIAEGRSVAEIREFLAARSGAPIPDTVARLLEDVGDRSAKVQDRGLARLIECADPALAALIANDSRSRKHCMRAGERHAHFFTLVSRGTREEEFAHHRKLFLTEQGYSYRVVIAGER